jgi:dynein heavy chain
VYVFNIHVESNIQIDKKEINEISASATQEAALEEHMHKIKTHWEAREFTILPYKDTDTFVLGGVDDIRSQLEDDQIQLATMSASRYAPVVQVVQLVSD